MKAILLTAALALSAVTAWSQGMQDFNLANPDSVKPVQTGQRSAPQPLVIDIPPAGSSSGVLTNSEIVSMLKAGLPAEVVAAKIKTSRCDFDTATTVLTAMHAMGVPAQVLAAMVEAPRVEVEKGTNDGHIRVFVTDSQSWEVRGGSFGQGSGSAAWGPAGGSARSSFSSGAYSSGGARPQTMEIVKTFGERCPDLIVTNRPDNASYVVTLDHEGGKALIAHRNKIGVFNRQGDAIFSRSTIMLGDSVKDACQAIRADVSMRQAAGGISVAGN